MRLNVRAGISSLIWESISAGSHRQAKSSPPFWMSGQLRWFSDGAGQNGISGYNGGGVVGKHVCVRQRLTVRQWLGLFQWRMFSGVDWKPFFLRGDGKSGGWRGVGSTDRCRRRSALEFLEFYLCAYRQLSPEVTPGTHSLQSSAEDDWHHVRNY